MYVDFNTVIPADFKGDHTSSWAGKTNPIILSRVYKRYRAPISKDECNQMLADLRRIIAGLEDRYREKVQSYKDLGVNISSDLSTKHDLKDAQSRILRYKAILKAYLYWLDPSQVIEEKTSNKPKTEAPNRLDCLFDLFVEFLGIYIDDLDEKIDPCEAIELSQDIKDKAKIIIQGRQEKLGS